MSTDPSIAARRADRRQSERRLVVSRIADERRESQRRSGKDRRLSPRVRLED